MITSEERNAAKLFDRSRELGVLDTVRFLWEEGSKLYPASRISDKGHAEFRKIETDRSIYRTIFYMVPCVAGKNCLETCNYVSVTLSPANLTRLTRYSESECLAFLQTLATGLETRIIPLKQGWYYLPITTVEKAERFLTALHHFTDL
jgi:hypothetical protein